jgi:Icc-related predicted phosphoesterase
MTDIHLNFLEAERQMEFVRRVRSHRADSILVGGDIGEAASVGDYLRFLATRLGVPVYFVLGNHDYYGGSIAEVRRAVRRLTAEVDGLHYLSECGPVALSSDVGLIGHDGWGDGRFGDFLRSPLVLNDYVHIREISGLSRADLLARLNALGDEAADHVRGTLTDALRSFRHVYLLTHVPPFREACVHAGRPSDDDWAPHFACRAVGETVREVMTAAPDRRLTVLCGHVHERGRCEVLPNVEVHTGGTEYGDPGVQGIFDIRGRSRGE